jgi:hypothetical protein
MKATVIPNSALTGTGGGGSRIVNVPTVTPMQGQQGDSTLSTQVPIEPASVNSGGVAPKSGDLLPKGVQ